jgi:peptidoglycan/xylan/chitin deacetylase (PgdA/CDA1 family)
MVLGGGVATAARTLLGKMAAASTAMGAPATVPKEETAQGAESARIDFIKSGPPDGKRIALTFDDGPTPGVTDLILDELAKRKLHATFFMLGQHITAAPDLARRVLAEGHEIGNHTFTHANLTKLADPQAEAEIQKAQEIMGELLNYRAAWFRPPYGALRQTQAGMLARRGMGIVLWSVDTADWSQPGEDKIIGTALAQTTPGSIILCHDSHQQTANAVGPILAGLLERGLAFATLSELMREAG